VRPGVALIAVLVAVVGVGAVGIPPAGAAPALVVSPATGLLEYHVVGVQATGLTPGDAYWITQCDPGGECAFIEGPADHPYIPSNATFRIADGTGSITTRLQLRRSGCVPDGCTVRVLDDPDIDEVLASAPLTFAATGTYQWPQASLQATFTPPVIEASGVGAAVTGMSPWARLSPNFPAMASIDVCRDDGELTGDDCHRGLDFEAQRFDIVTLADDDSGSGSGGFRLPRYLDFGATWDCAVQGCMLLVSQGGHVQELGNPVTQPVPITYAPEWAPWPSADAWIDEAYEPLTGQTYDANARQQITEALTAREQKAVSLLALAGGATDAPGAEEIGEVVRLYRAFFGRTPETGGLDYWLGRLHTGTTVSAIARAFGGTPEFKAMYGTVSNGTVVDRAYRNTLGREPDAAGRAYWIGRLQQGMARSTLLHHFSRSTEMRDRERPHVALTRVTSVLAERAPTRAEIEAVDADPGMAIGSGMHAVVAALLASGDVPRP